MIAAVLRIFALFVLCLTAVPALAADPAHITVDYPAPGAIFPPDFAAPTILYRDSQKAAARWMVEVTPLGDKAKPVRIPIAGEPMKIGEIDERCIADTNKLPTLTEQQQATHTWKPDARTWTAIKRSRGATVTILGLAAYGDQPVSRGSVELRIAPDPVGAPVFFRDVPLMPSEIEKGIIKPLPKTALPLVAWRLRYVQEEKSRLLVDQLPTCANCHSFSRDGKTLGLDLDGPQNDKGLYALTSIGPKTTIRNEDVVAWSSFRGKLGSKIRVGFMSQVSPSGEQVVTMVNPFDLLGAKVPGADAASSGPVPESVQGSYYVQNFKDYRFLQVFYPTRGILAWYSRKTGKLQPLPGADDPRYVHTNATWSPDGKFLIFARAEARAPYAEGVKPAEYANDPNETPMRYDLYRIPFNDGKGGTPEPVAGASQNGMSNSFPKISPDGRWLVYVQAKNGLLMRPDGQLYIVPVQGGKPRRMNCNTPLMNSWHSFSPNGRWMVFSSKSRSPYTQMFMTHIDENGNDTPAILVENATAANRAVNIPEFVNVPVDGFLKIDMPATEMYRHADNAVELSRARKFDEAIAEWQRALAFDPADTTTLNNYGITLMAAGKFDEAAAAFSKTLDADPENFKAYSNLAVALARLGRVDEALGRLRKAIEVNSADAKTQSIYGGMLMNIGKADEALPHLKRALELDPSNADANNNIGTLLARSGQVKEALQHFERAVASEPGSAIVNANVGRALAATGKMEEGLRYVEKAVELSEGRDAMILDRLSGLYATAGRFGDAAMAARKALAIAQANGDREMQQAMEAKIAQFEAAAR